MPEGAGRVKTIATVSTARIQGIDDNRFIFSNIGRY